MTNFPFFNGTGVQDLFLYGNAVVGDHTFGLSILAGVFFVSLFTLQNFYSLPRSLLASSWTTVLLGGLLLAASVITDSMFYFAFVVFAAVGFYVYFKGVD